MSAGQDTWLSGLLREQFAGPVPEFRSRPTSTSDLQAELDDDLTIARRRRDLVDALDEDASADGHDEHARKREGA